MSTKGLGNMSKHASDNSAADLSPSKKFKGADGEKPKYKLTYFNFRWLAEPIRYLFNYVDEDFEDKRVEMDEWEKIKTGKFPICFRFVSILPG